MHANIDIECLYLSLYHCNALVYENKESKKKTVSLCLHKIIVIEIKRKETIKSICQFLCQV